ncbi:MAG: carboxypeptidase M32 [Chloroflexi bacterium]|nr:carboxypeptidase M32 [Chloroflexota bacterium]
MEDKLQQLKQHLMEVEDLERTSNVLAWDQATYMPPGGNAARARQMALMDRLAHEKLTSAPVGKLLDELQPYAESLPYDADDASLIRLARRHFERAIKVPAAFIARQAEHHAMLYDLWARARPANDFAAVQPHLQTSLDLSRQYADYFPGYAHIADPLIDRNDEGMRTETVRAIFADLRAALMPLVQAIQAKGPVETRFLRQHYPEAVQWQFGRAVIEYYGYDFARGRQDKTHHPFMIKFSGDDVRITTRFDEHDLGDGLFSTLHEAGHALYEQNMPPHFEGLPLNTGTSAGIHESQSRLWENIVGRSRGFWDFFYPNLQAYFPDQLNGVPMEAFYAAINEVKPSLIRVDADEVTYNLHVMLRFDLELQLLEGTLEIKDLPEAWNARYESDLGVTPPDDRDGVLQDVHWYTETVGGNFQGYTLGNLFSAQFYEAALATYPEIPGEIAVGKFGLLRYWLTNNIYRHGSKFTADELVQRVTGGPLRVAPLVNYLREKYSALYDLDLN